MPRIRATRHVHGVLATGGLDMRVRGITQRGGRMMYPVTASPCHAMNVGYFCPQPFGGGTGIPFAGSLAGSCGTWVTLILLRNGSCGVGMLALPIGGRLFRLGFCHGVVGASRRAASSDRRSPGGGSGRYSQGNKCRPSGTEHASPAADF